MKRTEQVKKLEVKISGQSSSVMKLKQHRNNVKNSTVVDRSIMILKCKEVSSCIAFAFRTRNSDEFVVYKNYLLFVLPRISCCRQGQEQKH